MRGLLLVVASLIPAVAFADGASPVSPNLGVIEVLAEPGGDHLGVYPYVAASMLFPAGKVAIIPAVGVEWSPEFDRWGFVGTVTVDYAVASRVGLDLNLALTHDQQDHHWDDAIFLAGGGPGVSISSAS